MRLVTVVGARPQFIKAAAVTRAVRSHNAQPGVIQIQEVLVHTGQHYDYSMSQVFFDELDIPQPDYNLGVGSLAHGAQTGRILERLEEVLVKEKPDWVVVYGDTNSTLAGALAAAKLHIAVAHVEAGLRSFNRRMPEEINRVLTDHLSSFLFCPTETAVNNLKAEGIAEGVVLVGDVMYDCVTHYAEKVHTMEESVLAGFGLKSKSYYLATIHRAENTDDSGCLRSIVRALDEISSNDCPVVIPLHPRTGQRMAEFNLTFSGRVRVLPPVSYLRMVVLEKNAKAILTDSGGVQKEAYFHCVPCVTLREETEWVETQKAGANMLVGANSGEIASALRSLEKATWIPGISQPSGLAAPRILCHLVGAAGSSLLSGSLRTLWRRTS